MPFLSDLTAPDILMESGFSKHEQSTSKPERAVWYRKTFEQTDSNARIVIEVEYHLTIYDDPCVSYLENLNYIFHGCFLRLIDRQMKERWTDCFDEETEDPRTVGRLHLRINSVEDLTRFFTEF